MNLSNQDVQDIIRLLDSLPYGEFTLETASYTLTLRRTTEPGLWTQETQVRRDPVPAAPAAPSVPAASTGQPDPREPSAPSEAAGSSVAAGTDEGGAADHAARAGVSGPEPIRAEGQLQGHAPPSAPTGIAAHEVRAPLLGTFYRSPQPGAPPFVEVGSQVEVDTVVAIIETMKLMNPVYAGTSGTVSEICLDDGTFAQQDAVLLRIGTRGPKRRRFP